ncbi:XRE family transcriptional regulator [Deltaproteobacteria bacterium TL4]
MATNKDEIQEFEEGIAEVEDVPEEVIDLYPKEERSIVKMMADITNTAFKAVKAVTKTGESSLRISKAFFPTVQNSTMMKETGKSLHDLREVAGLTIQELTESLDLKDSSILEAVENGTATLSFELTLRLASLVSRHDPIPFIIRSLRTYNPDVWKYLEDWGVGRIPLHIERERQFLGIYRGKDSVRKLSDEGFIKVLEFTRAAFEMAVHYAIENEIDHN